MIFNLLFIKTNCNSTIDGNSNLYHHFATSTIDSRVLSSVGFVIRPHRTCGFVIRTTKMKIFDKLKVIGLQILIFTAGGLKFAGILGN